MTALLAAISYVLAFLEFPVPLSPSFARMDGQTLNVGRVMTPTLAMVVMRDAAIRVFKPEPFYSAELKFRNFQAGGERMKKSRSRKTGGRVLSGVECHHYQGGIDLLLELSCILHVSTDYLLMGSEPSKEEIKNDLLSIISELSTIAKKI